jgi:hypothetical protein
MGVNTIMDNVETMDLSGGLEGTTPILPPPPAETIKEEKNVNNVINMESTPIGDVMGSPADWETGSQMGMMPPQQPPQPLYQQQAPPAPQQKANPLNLTDEQMMAVLVGVVAAIASSRPVQEKLAGMIPQVGSDPQGMFALAVTGLVAAILFYFGKRAVL